MRIRSILITIVLFIALLGCTNLLSSEFGSGINENGSGINENGSGINENG